jgi:hypothetical protein
MSNGNQTVRVRHTAELTELPALAPGTSAFVEDDHYVYWSVGNLDAEVAKSIGWNHRNVWMPNHVYVDLLEARKAVFASPIAVAAALLISPTGIYRDRRQTGGLYVIADGDYLRRQGLLRSRSTRYVDAVIESRHIQGFVLPRIFHLSPRKRNHGGEQLWP